jgi:hypothetical protein
MTYSKKEGNGKDREINYSGFLGFFVPLYLLNAGLYTILALFLPSFVPKTRFSLLLAEKDRFLNNCANVRISKIHNTHSVQFTENERFLCYEREVFRIIENN